MDLGDSSVDFAATLDGLDFGAGMPLSGVDAVARFFFTRLRDDLADDGLLLPDAPDRWEVRARDAATERAENDCTRSSSRGVRGRLMITNSSSEKTPGVRGPSPR